jgi:hypothetical protein
MRSIVLSVLIAGTTTSLAAAAPAAADKGDYLQALQDTYTSLSTQQLLSEGAKICNATQNGKNSTDALVMVQKDLGVSVSAAGNIVAAAVVHLGC